MMTRSGLAAALAGIEGWLGEEEAWRLHRAAAEIPDQAPATVVEIGSWKGRSTIALATGVGARPGGGVVLAVDPHRGGRAHELTGEPDTFAAFEENLRGSGVADLVEPLRETSLAARGRVPDDSVDLLFLDGSHERDDVIADIDAWAPALRAGATVAFHDAISYPGVAAALRARVLMPGSPYRRPRLVQETLFVRHEPGSPPRAVDSLRAVSIRARLATLRMARRLTSRLRSRQ
jgi:predicted O-methyltransferase YrrM